MRTWKVAEPSKAQAALVGLGVNTVDAALTLSQYGSLNALLQGLDKGQVPLTVSGKKWTPSMVRRMKVLQALPAILAAEELESLPNIGGAEEAFRFLKPRLANREQEVFAVLFLTNKHEVLGYSELFQGTINQSTVHLREIVKAVLKENAAAIILAHNHPSGHNTPSPDDLCLTEEIKSIMRTMDVRVLDHMIVGGDGYFSFAREGLI